MVHLPTYRIHFIFYLVKTISAAQTALMQTFVLDFLQHTHEIAGTEWSNGTLERMAVASELFDMTSRCSLDHLCKFLTTFTHEDFMQLQEKIDIIVDGLHQETGVTMLIYRSSHGEILWE